MGELGSLLRIFNSVYLTPSPLNALWSSEYRFAPVKVYFVDNFGMEFIVSKTTWFHQQFNYSVVEAWADDDDDDPSKYNTRSRWTNGISLENNLDEKDLLIASP